MTALLLVSLAALAGSIDVDRCVQRVRADFAAVEAAVEAGTLSTTRFEIGGGQGQRQVEVHWEGGTEANFEADPYAAPFRLRRVALTQVLPAVGPATATFYYRGEGELFFAYLTGADAWDLGAWPLSPLDEVRAYFDEAGVACRSIWTSAVSEGKRHVVDLPDTREGHAKTAAERLSRQGRALGEALRALAQ